MYLNWEGEKQKNGFEHGHLEGKKKNKRTFQILSVSKYVVWESEKSRERIKYGQGLTDREEKEAYLETDVKETCK